MYRFFVQNFSDKGFDTGPANTVSFRQGANVEFEGPTFNPPTEINMGSLESSTGASSMSTAVAGDTTDPSKRDFSNPMYEAMGDMESQVMLLF